MAFNDWILFVVRTEGRTVVSYTATVAPTPSMNGLIASCVIFFDEAPDGIIPGNPEYDKGPPELEERCEVPLTVECKWLQNICIHTQLCTNH